MAKDQDTQPQSVVERLKAQKEARTGNDTATLPETKIAVSWPKFRNHGLWMKAQRISKKNPLGVQDAYAVLVTTFDGEHLTLDQFADLIPTNDAMFLLDKIMGESLGSDEGNAPS